MTGRGSWTWKPLGAWGSERGATWNSDPSVANRAADLTGGGGDYTTEGGGLTGQGAVRLPSLKYHPEGHEQCLKFVRTSGQGTSVRTDGMMPGHLEMCYMVDTVARMQQDLADIRAENRLLRTLGVPPVVHTPRQVAFTTTKVPRFGGTTSWEQYRQVFDAIVLSNGWDNEMAALLSLSLNGGTILPFGG